MKHLKTAKLSAIVNHVIMGFGSNKCVSVDVEPDVGAKVPREVIGAFIVGAPSKGATVGACVEAIILAADSRHDVAPNALLQRRTTINSIEIVEDWTVSKRTE